MTFFICLVVVRAIVRTVILHRSLKEAVHQTIQHDIVTEHLIATEHLMYNTRFGNLLTVV